jgi:polysaccharide export outer membrane protein
MAGKRHVRFAILALFCLSCSNLAPDYPYSSEPNPLLSEYVIGVADGVVITVWKHDEFNTSLNVRPDGLITLPLVGDMPAAGLTPSALKQAVTKELKSFIKGEAIVTVAVTAVNSYHVTVSGRVATPGRFNSSGYLTVADAIALAGGPDRFAKAEEVFIIRTDKSGKRRRIPVNYDQIKRGEHLHQNIYLLRGDQIFVP